MAIINTGGSLGSEMFDGSLSNSKATFWIGANILFDPQTGATNQVLLLVYREQDASVFTEQDASAFLNFVTVRAERISPGIKWSLVQSQTVPQRWVIKGEQDVV
jgi:hypothetical protein